MGQSDVDLELCDDVLKVIAEALQSASPTDLLTCSLVSRQWRRVMRQSIKRTSWQLLSDPEASSHALQRVLTTFPACTEVTICYPSDAALLRPHFHQSLSLLFQQRPKLQTVAIRGPAAIQFSLAPSLGVVDAVQGCASMTHLRSLSLTGQLANSTYRELHSTLHHLGQHLTRLSISSTQHQWTITCTAQQLLELPPLAPHLQVLELPLGLEGAAEHDESAESWCVALRDLSRLTALHRLAIHSHLYHTPQLCEAVATWSRLSNLRELQLTLRETCDPHWGQDMWDDPDNETASVWGGYLPHLTQLTSLVVTSDDFPQGMVVGLYRCVWLQHLELHHTGWALQVDLAHPRFTLCNLQVAKLCLGDADLHELCQPSLCGKLHTLHLHLKGMSYGPSLQDSGLAALSALSALQHLSCDAVSYALTDQDLEAWGQGCRALQSLQYRGPRKNASGRGLCRLTNLQQLTLASNGGSPVPSSLSIVHLPRSLTSLQLEAVQLATALGLQPGAANAPSSAAPLPTAARVATAVHSASGCQIGVGDCAARADASGAGECWSSDGQEGGVHLQHLRQLILHHCVLDAPLQCMLPACLTRLDLLDIRTPRHTLSLSGVVGACPRLVELRSASQSMPMTTQLCAFTDDDTMAIAVNLAPHIQELELMMGPLVTEHSFQHLARLNLLTGLDLTVPSESSCHSTNLTSMTQLRSLTLKFNQCTRSSMLPIDIPLLRAKLPNCSIRQHMCNVV